MKGRSTQDGAASMTTFTTPYVVCASCAHQVAAIGPLDSCENCGANSTFLLYFADADEADEESGHIYDAILTRRADVRFTH